MPAPRKPIAISAKAMAAEYPTSHFLARLVKARENVQAMMSVMLTPRYGDGWRGMLAVPPGSAIEKVLGAFRRETDIPLEILFFPCSALRQRNPIEATYGADRAGRPDVAGVVDSGAGP